MTMALFSRILNLKLSRFVAPLRHNTTYKTKMYMKANLLDSNELIKKYAPRLIYNTVIEKTVLKYEQQERRTRYKTAGEGEEPLPITLKYLSDEIVVKEDELPQLENLEDNQLVNFPFSGGYTLEDTTKPPKPKHKMTECHDLALEAQEEVMQRYQLQKEMKNWMLAYDNYDDSPVSEEAEDSWKINYGTPDPKTKISNVPCGGCGALLHCRDTAIPGYIPSEIFKNSVVEGGTSLETIICQRCHFLKNYNLALQVQVTPDDYPKVLSTISQQGGLVILLVDLLDFPCSVWPGIGEIFGTRTPIVLVGNKVDLLPQDSRQFLKHVKTTLVNNMKLQGFATFNIKEVALISAKTGYGVEDLITKLNSLHRVRGDVYIVGCTNVGKSSLFNAFLQSDYCKTQAIDLIQRATTSVWPGTTLNLLKFPIKRPAGYRQYLRAQRLEMVQKIETDERKLRKEQLRVTKNPKYASLIGHIDVTKDPEAIKEKQDLFVSNNSTVPDIGINENSKEYALSKWCYDTPGVVQPDQITHLLTTDELLLTLPKEIIIPRTFCIKPKCSLFIAGLARLDYIEGPGSVRLTVFASNELPITVSDLEDSDQVYEELLGTDLFKVPTGNNERISKWPKLEMAQEFSIQGVKWYKSANDVVLSSAGWVALTGQQGLRYKFQAWTPEKRGVYIRDCLLPHAVALMGKRIKHSVAYNRYKFFLQE